MSDLKEEKITKYKLLPNLTPLTSEELDTIKIEELNFTLLTKEEKKSLQTLTYARIISNLFSTYEEKEQTKLLKKLKQDFNKTFKKRIKTHKEECLISIILAEKLWREATTKYQDKNFKIEMGNLALTIWLYDDKQLQKKYQFSRSKMGKVAPPQTTEDANEIEKNNREIANFINEQLHHHLQLTLPPKRKIDLTDLKKDKIKSATKHKKI